MIRTDKNSYILAILSIFLVSLSSLKVQAESVSKVGAAIVGTITTSCTLATIWGGFTSYKEFKEWRKASTEFEADRKILQEMDAKIEESITVKPFGNQTIREHSIKVTPTKSFSSEQKTVFEKHSKSFLSLFKRKEEACNNHIGMAAFTLVMGLVSGAFIKVILNETLFAK